MAPWVRWIDESSVRVKYGVRKPYLAGEFLAHQLELPMESTTPEICHTPILRITRKQVTEEFYAVKCGSAFELDMGETRRTTEDCAGKARLPDKPRSTEFTFSEMTLREVHFEQYGSAQIQRDSRPVSGPSLGRARRALLESTAGRRLTQVLS